MCEDVYKIVLQNLDFRGLAALGSTCREAYRAQRSLTFLHFGAVTLSPAQALIRDRIAGMAVPPGHFRAFVYVCAPMGFGKTIAALAAVVAAPAADRFAIYVPSKAVSTWSAEVTKVFPEGKSPVLVAHQSRGAHLKAVQAAIAGSTAGSPAGWLPGVKGVVISFTSKAPLQSFVTRWATRAIADEAHTITGRGQGLLTSRHDRIAMLSANEPTWGQAAGAWDEIRVSNGYLRDTIPQALVRHVIIPPCRAAGLSEEMEFARSADKLGLVAGNLAEYKRALLGIFLELSTGGKVALYLPDGQPGDLIEGAMGEIAPGWVHVRFVGAVSKIRLFERSRCSVLLIRETKSEALNILGTHIIVVRPDWVSASRYMQLVGRILRPTNPNAAVGVYLVTPEGTATHRVYHYEALRSLRVGGLRGLDDGGDRYDAVDLKKVGITLKLCGSSLERAAPSERVAAIGISVNDSPDMARDVYAMWLKEKRPTVTAAQMAIMLDATEELLLHAPAPAPEPAGAPAAPDIGAFLDDLLG